MKTASMIDLAQLDDLARRLSNLVPPGLREGREELQQNFKSVLQAGLGKLDLVTREALAMALFVYAGSSQLAAIPLLLVGAPLWIILATAFCVNLRFVVFSLHLRSYLIHLPRLERLVSGYLTTDITYVLFVQRYPQPGQTPEERIARQAYLAGNSCINWVSWMGASVIGVALANFIPTAWGLGFAGILCLVGILCSLASTRLRFVAAAVAGVVAVMVYARPLKLNIIVAIAAAVAVGLLIEAVEHHRNPPELLLVPAEEDLPADEQQHVRDGDVVPVREERHP